MFYFAYSSPCPITVVDNVIFFFPLNTPKFELRNTRNIVTLIERRDEMTVTYYGSGAVPRAESGGGGGVVGGDDE